METHYGLPMNLPVGASAHADQLDNNAKKDSFEHFRRGLRSTEIITFDELFRKVQVLLALLEGEA